MKKNDIFKIKTPNGVEVKAVILSKVCSFSEHNSVGDEYITHFYLAYSQNRLFICIREYGDYEEYNLENIKPKFCREVCDYCIIPELDKLLENE